MKYYFFGMLLLITLSSCGDNSVSVNSKGSLIGRVSLYDNHQFLNNSEGVNISIDNTSLAASTNQNGFWQIDGVPAGVYSITYSKEGFYTEKNYNIQFVGSGTYSLYNNSLQKIIPITVTNLDITSEDSLLRINAEGTISAPYDDYIFVEIIFSKKYIIKEPEITFDMEMSYQVPADSINFHTYRIMTENQKTDAGLSSGDKLYATAFVLPLSLYGLEYYDSVTGKYKLNTYGITFSTIDSIYVP